MRDLFMNRCREAKNRNLLKQIIFWKLVTALILCAARFAVASENENIHVSVSKAILQRGEVVEITVKTQSKETVRASLLKTDRRRGRFEFTTSRRGRLSRRI
jgi:hypothetical protein